MATHSPQFPGPSRTFTAMAGGSALLCITLMVLWVRSVQNNDVLMLPRNAGDRWLVTSAFGTVTVQWEGRQTGQIKPGWVFMQNQLPRNWPNGWRWLYFHAYRGASRHYLPLQTARVYGVSAPHWFLIVLLGVLPLIWEGRFRRHRQSQWRIARGMCRACGYDLRATAASGGPQFHRCPECGLSGAIDDAASTGHGLASVG